MPSWTDSNQGIHLNEIIQKKEWQFHNFGSWVVGIHYTTLLSLHIFEIFHNKKLNF